MKWNAKQTNWQITKRYPIINHIIFHLPLLKKNSYRLIGTMWKGRFVEISAIYVCKKNGRQSKREAAEQKILEWTSIHKF